jgi:hypothetical protein
MEMKVKVGFGGWLGVAMAVVVAVWVVMIIIIG